MRKGRTVATKYYGQYQARLTGPCPKCHTPTRSHGMPTKETAGLPKLIAARNHCTRCDYTSKNTGKPRDREFDGFAWTPELLKDAVDYALERLDEGQHVDA